MKAIPCNVYKKLGLTPLFLFAVVCCVGVMVSIWRFELFPDITIRILISVFVAIAPLGLHSSGAQWGSTEEKLWIVSFLVFGFLLVLSDRFDWSVLASNTLMLLPTLVFGGLVWKLTERNGLLLTGLALAFVALMIYWVAAFIGKPGSLNFLLLPLPVVLFGGVLWTPLALGILDSARRRKHHRVRGPGMQALAMATLFLPVILVVVAVPGVLGLGQAWSAVSLTLVGVLLSAVISEPLRRFLLEWGKLATK